MLFRIPRKEVFFVRSSLGQVQEEVSSMTIAVIQAALGLDVRNREPCLSAGLSRTFWPAVQCIEG